MSSNDKKDEKPTAQSEVAGITMLPMDALAIENFLEDEENSATFSQNIVKLLCVRFFAENKSSEQWQAYNEGSLLKVYKRHFRLERTAKQFVALALQTLENVEKTVYVRELFLRSIKAAAEQAVAIRRTGTIERTVHFPAFDILSNTYDKYKTQYKGLNFLNFRKVLAAFTNDLEQMSKNIQSNFQESNNNASLKLAVIIMPLIALLALMPHFNTPPFLYWSLVIVILIGMVYLWRAPQTAVQQVQNAGITNQAALEDQLATLLGQGLVIRLSKKVVSKNEVTLTVTASETPQQSSEVSRSSGGMNPFTYFRTMGFSKQRIQELRERPSTPDNGGQAANNAQPLPQERKKVMHYKNEIHLQGDDFALLSLEGMDVPREMGTVVEETFEKGLSKHTGIVHLDQPENGHIYKMKLQGNTKDCVYATWFIKNPDGTRTYIFNYYSEHSHNKKRHTLEEPKEILPEQWEDLAQPSPGMNSAV